MPAGLREMSASLHALVEFLGIDEDLVAAAAENSAELGVGPGKNELDIWIRSLAEKEKNEVLCVVWKKQSFRSFCFEATWNVSLFLGPFGDAGDHIGPLGNRSLQSR